LPDHLHAIRTLPPGDADFASRWRQIKSGFSRALPSAQLRSRSQVRRRETGFWQRRFWEHAIRDDRDFERHVDYIHFNPVKHGYVTRVCDWPYSSFHRYVNNGLLPADWGGDLGEIEGRFGE
jgi:putative transposase